MRCATEETVGVEMTTKAEELVNEWAPRLLGANQIDTGAATQMLEAYGRLVQEAAAKVANNPGVFDYDLGRQDAAKAIREMPLP